MYVTLSVTDTAFYDNTMQIRCFMYVHQGLSHSIVVELYLVLLAYFG